MENVQAFSLYIIDFFIWTDRSNCMEDVWHQNKMDKQKKEEEEAYEKAQNEKIRKRWIVLLVRVR